MKAAARPPLVHDRVVRAGGLRQLQLGRHPARRDRRARARAQARSGPAGPPRHARGYSRRTSSPRRSLGSCCDRQRRPVVRPRRADAVRARLRRTRADRGASSWARAWASSPSRLTDDRCGFPTPTSRTFPAPTVIGHSGELVAGRLGGPPGAGAERPVPSCTRATRRRSPRLPVAGLRARSASYRSCSPTRPAASGAASARARSCSSPTTSTSASGIRCSVRCFRARAVSRHVGPVRPCPARAGAGGGAAAEDRAGRGRLRAAARSELRDAGGDPDGSSGWGPTRWGCPPRWRSSPPARRASGVLASRRSPTRRRDDAQQARPPGGDGGRLPDAGELAALIEGVVERLEL